jgi:hypothetical protein
MSDPGHIRHTARLLFLTRESQITPTATSNSRLATEASVHRWSAAVGSFRDGMRLRVRRARAFADATKLRLLERQHVSRV